MDNQLVDEGGEQERSGLNCEAPLMGKSCNQRGAISPCLKCRALKTLQEELINEEKNSAVPAGRGETAKFTAGPWHVQLEWGLPGINAGAERIASVICTKQRRDSNRDELIANARLIAAAPSLYEAIILAAHQLDILLMLRPEHDGGRNRAVLELLNAALASVHGGEAESGKAGKEL